MDEKKKKTFEKKQELVEAAIKEFGEKGYDKASLNNILREAGISKGTFYYHFENKEDLYAYIISIVVEQKKSFFANNIKSEIYNGDIFSILKSLTSAGLKFARANPQISKFSESFLKEKGSEIYHKMMNRFSLEPKNYDYVNSLIERAYANEEIREDLPKEFVKRIIPFLFSHIGEIMDLVKMDEFVDAADLLVEFMKNGLAKPKN